MLESMPSNAVFASSLSTASDEAISQLNAFQKEKKEETYPAQTDCKSHSAPSQ